MYNCQCCCSLRVCSPVREPLLSTGAIASTVHSSGVEVYLEKRNIDIMLCLQSSSVCIWQCVINKQQGLHLTCIQYHCSLAHASLTTMATLGNPASLPAPRQTILTITVYPHTCLTCLVVGSESWSFTSFNTTSADTTQLCISAAAAGEDFWCVLLSECLVVLKSIAAFASLFSWTVHVSSVLHHARYV